MKDDCYIGTMDPPNVYLFPEDERFQDYYRKWQGIPSVAITPNGRIFVDFFSGQEAEVNGNFIVVTISDDKGKSWRSPAVIVAHGDPGVRLHDPNLWLDPTGKIWITWAQSHGSFDGRVGVWRTTCANPDEEIMVWTKPERIANGNMLNKPICTSKGEWLLPCAIWACEEPSENHDELKNERFSNVYSSKDNGKTFKLKGGADVPNRWFDEHMIVERKDGSLWMLVRALYGIGESFSYDYGKTWAPGRPSSIEGPCSRFHISRLKSGRLLLVNHYKFDGKIDPDDIKNQPFVRKWKGRNNLTAMLSEDEGETWKGFLLIDERNEAAYPDAVEGSDGIIYIVYDYERVKEREIFMAKVTEEEILNGQCKNPEESLRILVNKARG